MINLIGNSCVSSYIVRDYLKQQFINPFVWCWLKNDDISFVIDNYYKINWYKYEIIFYGKDNNYISFYIDKSFTIYYPHYILFDCETCIKGINVYSKDIVNFSEEKYNNRLKRMIEYKIKPIFLLGGSYEDQIPSKQNIEKYENKDDVIIINNDYNIYHNNVKFTKLFWNENKEYFINTI